MSFVERSGLACKNVNVFTCPRMLKVGTTCSLLRNNTLIQATVFADEFYDYALARQLLGQVYLEPLNTLQEVCSTDLSPIFVHL